MTQENSIVKGTNGDVQVGAKIIEGKTKQVFDITEQKGNVLIVSKDRITAGDGARADNMAGKAAISTSTAVKIFEFLNTSGTNPNEYTIEILSIVTNNNYV